MKTENVKEYAPAGFVRLAATLCGAVAIWLLVLSSGSSKATSIAGHQANFDVSVWNMALFPTYTANRSLKPTLSFSAALDIPSGGPLLTADVYFGLYTPGNDAVFTWVKGEGGPALVRGMSPVMTGVDLHTPAKYLMASVLGADRDPSYTFSGDEKAGMYTVFALYVLSGSDPRDPASWSGVRMVPLVVR